MIFNAASALSVALSESMEWAGCPEPQRWIIRRGLLDRAGDWYNSHNGDTRVAMNDQMPPGAYLLCFDSGNEYIAGDCDIWLCWNHDDLDMQFALGNYSERKYFDEEELLFKLGDEWHDMNDTDEEVQDKVYEFFADLGQAVVAIYWFAQGKLAVVERETHASRASIAGGGPIPEVTVIRLRRREELDTDHDPMVVRWSHRWLVRGHIRHLSEGRTTFVRAHVKGPKDKPIVVKKEVRELVR